jgi:hypothetical protein
MGHLVMTSEAQTELENMATPKKKERERKPPVVNYPSLIAFTLYKLFVH